MQRPPVPGYLRALLESHVSTHAPHYPPHQFADHGPMAYLALFALGAERSVVEGFAERYRRQLAPLGSATRVLDSTTWSAAMGETRAYPDLLHFFAGEVQRRGTAATLETYLPRLSSGWVKDAYHPVIRLGYGIEFGVPSEVAAGLAYLACAGDDPMLLAAARRDPERTRGAEYLQQVRSLADPRFSRGGFGRRYARVVRDAPLGPASPSAQTFGELASASLGVFHATHDFFALHLVTASHAARLCAPFAGSPFPALFSLGIAAGYLAIGAPDFVPIDASDVVADELDGWQPRPDVDEHDVKCAYACRALSAAHDDPAYSWVMGRYLRARGSIAGPRVA